MKIKISIACIMALIVGFINSNIIYPKTFVVTEIENDIVYIEDFNGYIYSFYGADDWQIGDICSSIMFTNNTNDITDDVILNCRYNGNIKEVIHNG